MFKQDFTRMINDNAFLDIEDYRERIDYILNNVRSEQEFMEVCNDIIENNRAKSSKNLANALNSYRECIDYYSEHECTEALHSINEAIRQCPHQPPRYVNLIPMFNMRSIILSDLEEYETALANVELALDIYESEEVITQKVHCLWNLNRNKEAIDLIEEVLDYPFDEEFKLELIDLKNMIESEHKLYSHNNIESETIITKDVYFNEKIFIFGNNPEDPVGRHMVAKENIESKTLLFEERAQSGALYEKRLLKYCTYCYKYVKYTFWACNQCNECVFCNRDCAEKAWNQYHRHECCLNQVLYALGIDRVIGFRNVLKTGHRYAAQFCQFVDALIEENGQYFNIENWIFTHKDSSVDEYDKDINEKRMEFQAVLTFEDHLDYPDIEKSAIIMEVLRALYYTTLMRIKGAIIFTSYQTFCDFTNILISFTRKIAFNAFDYILQDTINNKVKSISKNIYIIGCFINNSCDPNVTVSTPKGILTFHAEKDIKEGEDISMSYGITKQMLFDERQEQYRTRFLFACRCRQCMEDVKSMPALRCHNCDGPVFFSVDHPNDRCLLCLRKYQDMNQAIQQLMDITKRFEVNYDRFLNNQNPDQSFRMAKQAFEQLVQLVYPENIFLLQWRQMIENPNPT